MSLLTPQKKNKKKTMTQKQRQTFCSVFSKYMIIQVIHFYYESLLPNFYSGGLEKYLETTKISNICINIRLVNSSNSLSWCIGADERRLFTVYSHSLAQVLLQPALRVLQLKLLGAITWHMCLIKH